MTLENHASSVLCKIGQAQNYQQVETIISSSMDGLSETLFPEKEFANELEKEIECLSPIALNSTQFSCFRYALIYLRNYVSFSKRIIQY